MRGTLARALTLCVLIVAAGTGYVAVLSSSPESAPAPSPYNLQTSGSGAGLAPQATLREAGQRPPPGDDSGAGTTGSGNPLHAQFERALRARPKDPQLLRQLAQQATGEDPDTGARMYRQLVRAYPSDALSWVGLAEAEWASGDRASALAAARRALELEPRSAAGHVLMGRLLTAGPRSEVRAAVDHWKRAIELDPGGESASDAHQLISLYEGR